MDLQVNRSNIQETRLVDLPQAPLQAEQVRVRVDSFGLTANNISYVVAGDMLGYWNFFPAEDPWGRSPVWGFGEIVESTSDAVPVGRRIFGYLPMSEDFVISAGRADEQGFSDVAEHRSSLAGAYNRYVYTEAAEAGSAEEDRRMVLYPLFFTSFVVDDFLADNDFFGATALIISSASAKTALGIARQAVGREGLRVIGITSPGNLEFTEGLDVYSNVIVYGDEATIPAGPAVYVDVSGDGAVRVALHEHLGDDLRHDMILGATHWEAMGAGGGAPLPGVAPEFFFAPSQLAKRAKDWGQAGLDARMGEAWASYAPWAASWIDFQHSNGADRVAEIYLELLENRSDPAVGHVVSLHSA